VKKNDISPVRRQRLCKGKRLVCKEANRLLFGETVNPLVVEVPSCVRYDDAIGKFNAVD
jgi:hypothetical protein